MRQKRLHFAAILFAAWLGSSGSGLARADTADAKAAASARCPRRTQKVGQLTVEQTADGYRCVIFIRSADVQGRVGGHSQELHRDYELDSDGKLEMLSSWNDPDDIKAASNRRARTVYLLPQPGSPPEAGALSFEPSSDDTRVAVQLPSGNLVEFSSRSGAIVGISGTKWAQAPLETIASTPKIRDGGLSVAAQPGSFVLDLGTHAGDSPEDLDPSRLVDLTDGKNAACRLRTSEVLDLPRDREGLVSFKLSNGKDLRALLEKRCPALVPAAMRPAPAAPVVVPSPAAPAPVVAPSPPAPAPAAAPASPADSGFHQVPSAPAQLRLDPAPFRAASAAAAANDARPAAPVSVADPLQTTPEVTGVLVVTPAPSPLAPPASAPSIVPAPSFVPVPARSRKVLPPPVASVVRELSRPLPGAAPARVIPEPAPAAPVAELPSATTSDIVPVTPPPAPGANCLDLAREYFRAGDNRDRLREYLAIQGKLTLHRLAWAFLKLNDGDASSLEEVIQDLLVRRDPELYRRFVRGGPRAISDGKLREVVGLLRGETRRRFGRDPRSQGFLLEESDLKMLDLLARSETAFGRGGQGGIMGFAAMIDASYRGRIDTPQGRALNLRIAERTVRGLQQKAATLHAALGSFLETRGCGGNPETAIASCLPSASPVTGPGLGALLEGSREVQDALFDDLRGGETELQDAFRWGSYWLRVSRRTTAAE